MVAQLVKNPPLMQETLDCFLGRKICYRTDKLPSPVFLGFPGGSAAKESGCNMGPGFDPWVGEIPFNKGMAIHFNVVAWRIPWTDIS